LRELGRGGFKSRLRGEGSDKKRGGCQRSGPWGWTREQKQPLHGDARDKKKRGAGFSKVNTIKGGWSTRRFSSIRKRINHGRRASSEPAAQRDERVTKNSRPGSLPT